MATIKRAGNRIITKVVNGARRVSCSCCEEDGRCCVYPANCGKGPESVLVNGSIFQETFTGSLVYGDTQNGIALEDEVWAVYRNGSRSTRSCLSFALSGTSDTGALLASTYSISFTYNSSLFSGTLEGIDDFFQGADCGGEGVPCGLMGQCQWSGFALSTTQDFDEGFLLFFNKDACRWELWSGPADAFYAYRDESDLRGEYIGNLINPVIS
jgi:hypothetical protein